MIRYIIPMIASIVVAAPVLAQDAYHIRVDGQIYDTRTLPVPRDPEARERSLHDERYDPNGVVLRGTNSNSALAKVEQEEIAEKARQALVAAGCLRPDETDLSRHDCYVNSDGHLVHRPARDNNGRPQGDRAMCRDGTYSFSEHTTGTCSHHGGVEHWE